MWPLEWWGIQLPTGQSASAAPHCVFYPRVPVAHPLLLGKAPDVHTVSEGASVLPCHDTNTKPMEDVSCVTENVQITKAF